MKYFLKESYESTDSLGNLLSPEQEAFFKDSKIRDAKGQLLVCHHGSRNKFEVFRSDRAFNKKQAFIWFAEQDYLAKQYGSHVYNVYLNITNPLDIGQLDVNCLRRVEHGPNNWKWVFSPAALRLASILQTESKELSGFIRSLVISGRIFLNSEEDYEDLYLFDIVKNPEFRALVYQKFPDVDGLICKDDDGNISTYGCFYPNQIKSIDNQFPTNDPSIYK